MMIFFSHKVSAQSFSQFYLSEVWDKEGGQMPIFYKNATTTDSERNVYVVGATASDTSTNSPYPWETTILQTMYDNNFGLGYSAFNGTSAAAPHVSGVAALMLSAHNTSNGAPNNLATEDVEQILQKTAYRAQNNLFYDNFDAWGLINAGLAVQQVDYPNYFVKHYYNNNSFKTVTSFGQTTMTLPTGNEFNVQPGTYVANKLLVTWNFNITLDNNHEIIDFWPLFSKSCAGFRHTSDWQYSYEHFEHFAFEPSLYDIYNQEENIGFGTNTLNTITVKATYYFVKNLANSTIPVNKWLPECGTNQVNQLVPFSFSLHIKENNELAIPENQITKLQLFPNPAENSITLKLSNQPIQEIIIFDLQGRVIFQEHTNGASSNSQIDVSDFSNGVYIAQVMSTHGNVSSSKFIKK